MVLLVEPKTFGNVGSIALSIRGGFLFIFLEMNPLLLAPHPDRNPIKAFQELTYVCCENATRIAATRGFSYRRLNWGMVGTHFSATSGNHCSCLTTPR